MTTSSPLLICITPVRNEAWVLHAFLKITSLWADYIIIADQGSTDGSIEIAKGYSKVILIDNSNQNFNEDERQKLLINRAREIDGDKILFGFDADEILTANFNSTNDWTKIINSKPGDVFWLKWAQIDPNLKHYYESDKVFFPWIFHDDNIEPHQNYVRNIHSMRIPYPIDEKQTYYIDEFKVMHFSHLNPLRVLSKSRFYKFVDWELNRRSVVKLSRTYSIKPFDDVKYQIPNSFIRYEKEPKFHIFDYIVVDENRFWYDDYIVSRINKSNILNVKKLDIWDETFMGICPIDCRSFIDRIVHGYLYITRAYSSKKIIKLFDKFLMKIGY